MEPLYSILTFAQYYKDGYLYFNIVVLPRNINIFKSIDGTTPAFADAEITFDCKIINQLKGLPIIPNVTKTLQPEIISEITDKKTVLQGIIKHLEYSDGLKISDNVTENKDHKFQADKERFKNISIRKYLPISYRNSFNFTTTRTKYAILDDEYECIVKNKEKKQTDTVTDRTHISWGKLIAFILRNPKLAEKAGLIYKARIATNNEIFAKGGWLYHEFAADCSLHPLHRMTYAARIPLLKENRQIFSPVLFPVSELPDNNVTLDQVMQESILYNDGFAKIVHANQPVNQDLLQETDYSNPPVKDIGIRLGWDDEQLLVWNNRQMKQKDEESDNFIDAPLGIFGYKIDVRKSGETQWLSQNMVYPKQNIGFTNQVVAEASQKIELPYEVYPSSHGNTLEEGFWLPMYYASWNGKTVVLPDAEAQEIHQLFSDKMIKVPSAGNENGLNKSPKPASNPYVQDEENHCDLLYGTDYDFRIRLMDISGGGPNLEDQMLNGGQNPVAKIHFKRNIGAAPLRVENAERFYRAQSKNDVKDMSILENILDGGNILKIHRPELSYPSVSYTGKYTDAAALLKAKITDVQTPQNPQDRKEYTVGLPDPDVNSFKIVVEVKTLEMDNALSDNGMEPYILLYDKIFEIPKDLRTENYDIPAEIKIVYQDFDILHFNNFNEIGGENELVLPTCRNLRITAIPIVDGADASNDYASEHIREGKKIQFTSYCASSSEKNLLSEINGGLRAFYLQPEKTTDRAGNKEQKTLFKKSIDNGTSVELQRLADALDLSVKNLTLEGRKGNRVQFGASHLLRHSLAPESGSVTFSSVKELFNHWIVSLDFSLLRDWSWNALNPVSFTIERTIRIEGKIIEELKEVGDIEVKDVANMSMIMGDVNREQSRIIFLDVIDPEQLQQDFPREIYVEYNLKTNFLENYSESKKDKYISKKIELPVTIIPRQTPKLISTGIAMTPYSHDEENYKYSNERQKYIWLEFEESPNDPEDTYYARILSYAPDPYLCIVTKELIENRPEDAVFALNEEKIREIIPNMTNDFAGVGVMQELIPETTDGKSKTFLLPLPPGLHSESPELFGFFTYEIRIGHKKEIWSTAQGRYGRPLKINGVQHAIPELVCSAYRNEEKIQNKTSKFVELRAPHALAVLNGKNISSFPPTTSLWYLLYTQVMQADGKSFRNILIKTDRLIYTPKKPDSSTKYRFVDQERYASSKIYIEEIGNTLHSLGLPRNNNISALAIEIFPMENNWQVSNRRMDNYESLVRNFEKYVEEMNNQKLTPLLDHLGHFRILRSSRLTSLAEVCCEDC